MQTVTLSPKFQVVIPRSVRENLGLRPGQKLRVVEHAGRIELIPEGTFPNSWALSKASTPVLNVRETECELRN